jgi:hypothetical protein
LAGFSEKGRGRCRKSKYNHRSRPYVGQRWKGGRERKVDRKKTGAVIDFMFDERPSALALSLSEKT